MYMLLCMADLLWVNSERYAGSIIVGKEIVACGTGSRRGDHHLVTGKKVACNHILPQNLVLCGHISTVQKVGICFCFCFYLLVYEEYLHGFKGQVILTSTVLYKICTIAVCTLKAYARPRSRSETRNILIELPPHSFLQSVSSYSLSLAC